METVDQILREMREDIAKGNVPSWADFGGEAARAYVARLEAAIKREREAVGSAATYEAVIGRWGNGCITCHNIWLTVHFEHI